MLGPVGVLGAIRGAFFVPACVTWLPWGTGGSGMDCFGCAWRLAGVSPAHWRLSLWAVCCVSGAVDRDVRLCLVLFSMILLFPNYGRSWG